VCFRNIVECQNAPSEAGEQIGAERDKGPEWELQQKARISLQIPVQSRRGILNCWILTNQGNNLLLHVRRQRNKLEEENKVELQTRETLILQHLLEKAGGWRTELKRSATEMVCCARVMLTRSCRSEGLCRVVQTYR
jgi:hypothetical protein